MTPDQSSPATEITHVVPDPSDPGNRVHRVGGPGWLKDTETVIAEIDEGQEYYVVLGSARVPVLAVDFFGDRYLRTDPIETSRNALPNLPTFPSASRAGTSSEGLP